MTRPRQDRFEKFKGKPTLYDRCARQNEKPVVAGCETALDREEVGEPKSCGSLLHPGPSPSPSVSADFEEPRPVHAANEWAARAFHHSSISPGAQVPRGACETRPPRKTQAHLRTVNRWGRTDEYAT